MQETIPGVPAAKARVFGPFGRMLLAVSRAAAILGGVIFVLLVVMSIVSIVGRKLASSPVPGDVELLQMCSAVAAAMFFAYCHLNGGDVKVDFFTAKLSPKVVNLLDAFGSLLFGIVGALLTWRTTLGALQVMRSEETSMILSIPQWIAQMLMVPGFALFALAGFYMVTYHWHKRLESAGASA